MPKAMTALLISGSTDTITTWIQRVKDWASKCLVKIDLAILKPYLNSIFGNMEGDAEADLEIKKARAAKPN